VPAAQPPQHARANLRIIPGLAVLAHEYGCRADLIIQQRKE
jgi:hypothetical protein